jgi:hypothetical protein
VILSGWLIVCPWRGKKTNKINEDMNITVTEKYSLRPRLIVVLELDTQIKVKAKKMKRAQ